METFSISRIGFNSEGAPVFVSPPRSEPRRLEAQRFIHAIQCSIRFFRFLVIGSRSPIRVMNEEERVRRRRAAKAVGVIVLFVLGVVVAVGWRQRVRAVREQRISALVERSRYAMREARLLSSLDLVRARAILDEHARSVDAALEATQDKQSRRALSSLLEELRATIDEVSRIHRVTPALYLDLSLVREDTSGSFMDLAGDTLFVLDREQVVILSISTAARAGSVVAGGQALAGARWLAAASDAVYVLTDDAIVNIDQPGGSARRSVTNDEQWQDVRFISAYGGNIYAFDQGTSEFYKYAGETDGFGQRQRWLKPGVTVDVSQPMDLAIDGSVWVLGRDGAVARFDRGDRMRFRIQPVDDLTDVVAFAVPIPGTRIWVLDRAHTRVVAFDRESGVTVGQWVGDAFADAVDIAVSEEREMLYVLTRDAVSTVSLAEEP